MTIAPIRFFPLETIALLVGIIVPIAGVAFGLGVLHTKLDHQREELKTLKEKVDGLGSILAAEELTELRKEQRDKKS